MKKYYKEFLLFTMKPWGKKFFTATDNLYTFAESPETSKFYQRTVINTNSFSVSTGRLK